jgi:hypothetical protein
MTEKIQLNTDTPITPLPESPIDPDYIPPDPGSLSCFGCVDRLLCPYVDDAYNTNGDCLAVK